ncbi:retrovirus-related pol polyprotein from transposon TNT 1-94 [Tanacetum coccineum]
MMGYSFYYPPKNKVFVAWNDEFFENEVIDHEASESLENFEITQEEDTHPSLETSLNHEEDDQEIDEPQSDINPIRDLGEPTNYKAALLDPESDKWLNAMNVEMQSIKDNEVWKLVKIPPDAKTVGHKWLFKKKTDMDRAIHTYKARLVAKGLTQTLGIDYEETFSPIADIRNPCYAHWTVVKNILKYLRNTKDMFLFYEGDIKRELRVSCYTDADDMKSQTGHVFVLNGDAGYIAAFDALKEAVWIRKFITGLGVVPTIEEPINMYCDNTRAIAIAKDHGVTKGARHFRAKVHYLRETIEMGNVRIEKVDIDDNLADPFTKALAFPKHSELTEKKRNDAS